MLEGGRLIIVAGLLAGACTWWAAGASAAGASASLDPQDGPAATAAIDLSAQTRRAERPRIRVHPLPGPLRRECVPVFQERWIPQWGGWVLYAGQRCWWTRAPA